MASVAAQVIVLAGPSGSGKSHLARRLRLPVLRLDDFYRDGSDPALPRITTGANAGLVDWDDPGSWLCDEAVGALTTLCRTGTVETPVYSISDNGRTGAQTVSLDGSHLVIAEGANSGLVDWDDPRSWLGEEAIAALTTLCRTGRVEVPIYDIAHDGRHGWHTLSLDGARLVVAEGLFAHHVVAPLRSSGLLAAAYCLRQHPMVTFWRRLSRDLREHRKPPLVLVRRGLALMRDQRRIVAAAVAAGCEPVSADQAYARVLRLPAAEPRP